MNKLIIEIPKCAHMRKNSLEMENEMENYPSNLVRKNFFNLFIGLLLADIFPSALKSEKFSRVCFYK